MERVASELQLLLGFKYKCKINFGGNGESNRFGVAGSLIPLKFLQKGHNCPSSIAIHLCAGK